MITHEEARKQTKFIHQTHRQELMINYITQQEKKDKLLELYREHKKLVPFKTGLGKDSKRVIDISIEIKALEEELK